MNLRDYLELGYFVAGIVLAIAALYGLKQIRISKTDINDRKKIASMEKAMEYANLFDTKYAEYIKDFDISCMQTGVYLKGYEDLGELKISNIDPAITARRIRKHGWHPAFNVLETVASAFIIGLADKDVGYSIIGTSFCRQVYKVHDIIIFNSKIKEFPKYMEMTIKLYKTWAPRYLQESFSKKEE
ncbi:MAG: hypothetical protein NTZ12_04590 [Candidatus Aminicenantes bacterium]|nr:hypothetical protein [Candidatus Aminicenantes bacterium]